jgi:DNA processing protein
MTNLLRTCLALSLIPNMGARRGRALLNAVSEPEAVFRLTARDLLAIQGIGKSVAQGILSFTDWDEVDRLIDRTHAVGSELIPLDDPRYPARLREIFDPPLILWAKGDLTALNQHHLAIVGTRMPSSYGRETAERFAETAVQAGMGVVSGLAYGIDTVAHQAVVDRGGVTVAVLGSGIDRIYPSVNTLLADRIITSGGCVISEFPPGTKPEYMNFPVRNRVVSGLSVGVLIVETGLSGGSMITARLAIDQNREVFVIPHPLSSKKGGGGHRLIREGTGKLVESMSDVLEELPWILGKVVVGVAAEARWKSVSLPDEDRRVCALLERSGRVHIDALSEAAGLPTHVLLMRLLTLECDGIVRQTAGKEFELV